MTKDSYFEMCEMLGQEPIDEEIPVDHNDFPLEVQQSLAIYNLLEDRWDSMGGGYMGKSYTPVFEFLKLYEVDPLEWLLVIEFLQHIDVVRSKLVAEKLKAKSPATK
jgi:hypothetical protein